MDIKNELKKDYIKREIFKLLLIVINSVVFALIYLASHNNQYIWITLTIYCLLILIISIIYISSLINSDNMQISVVMRFVLLLISFPFAMFYGIYKRYNYQIEFRGKKFLYEKMFGIRKYYYHLNEDLCLGYLLSSNIHDINFNKDYFLRIDGSRNISTIFKKYFSFYLLPPSIILLIGLIPIIKYFEFISRNEFVLISLMVMLVNLIEYIIIEYIELFNSILLNKKGLVLFTIYRVYLHYLRLVALYDSNIAMEFDEKVSESIIDN